MREYGLTIRNGTIVDGTGGIPAYRGDIAIKQGKIAMISGRIKATANKEVDATGCIVAPGAIDLHNHYDLQLNWDPYATMSGWHGVTSVTIGQCGFGFAPCKPEDREAAMRLMTRIEAIPLHTMELGLRWDWVTFPQWLESLATHPLGVNVGALVPFNALRLYVMGVEASRTRVRGTEKEIAEMQAILHEAMHAGAFGWSAMKTLANRPDDGRFIPSQVASNEEFLALAEVLAEFGVGHIGWTRGAAERPLPLGEPDLIGGGDPGPAVAAVTGASALLMEAVEGDAPGRGREDFLIQMCLASGRPLQWGAVSVNEHAPLRYKEQLAFLERAHAEGALMYAQTSAMSSAPVFELADGGVDGRYRTLGSWPVSCWGTRVRAQDILSREKRHYKLSGLPAWIAGFTDRGILKEGYAADIIVYDQAKLGLQYDSPVYATDFPGGERRIIQKAKGIRYTIVNGVVTFEEGTVCTGATPGKLLRSYDMVSR